jgi:hypothetical protein
MHWATTDSARSAIDQELELVDEAIALVASGAAPRVALAGIAHAEEILLDGQRHALAAGLRVRPLRDGNGTTDLLVEQLT